MPPRCLYPSLPPCRPTKVTHIPFTQAQHAKTPLMHLTFSTTQHLACTHLLHTRSYQGFKYAIETRTKSNLSYPSLVASITLVTRPFLPPPLVPLPSPMPRAVLIFLLPPIAGPPASFYLCLPRYLFDKTRYTLQVLVTVRMLFASSYFNLIKI